MANRQAALKAHTTMMINRMTSVTGARGILQEAAALFRKEGNHEYAVRDGVRLVWLRAGKGEQTRTREPFLGNEVRGLNRPAERMTWLLKGYDIHQEAEVWMVIKGATATEMDDDLGGSILEALPVEDLDYWPLGHWLKYHGAPSLRAYVGRPEALFQTYGSHTAAELKKRIW